MNFDWLSYLEEFEGVDVSPIRNILETEAKLIQSVIKEAFSAHPFVSKDEAKLMIEDFEQTSPKGIPEGFVTEYKTKIVAAIDSLNEGEIKIIINNDVNKGSNRAVDVVGDMDEAKKPAGKRGRPPKKIIEAAPIEENADEIIQGSFVKIAGDWFEVDSVNGDVLFVKDCNPSEDAEGPVYHKFSTEQVEEISSELPAVEPLTVPPMAPLGDIGGIGGEDEDDGITTIRIITPDDFDDDGFAKEEEPENDEVTAANPEEKEEEDGAVADFGFDLDWSDIEDEYAEDLKDGEEEEKEEEPEEEEIDGIEVIEEPEDEEDEKKEEKAEDEEEEDESAEDNDESKLGFDETLDVDGIDDYDSKVFEPKDDTSDENGKSNLFNKNNEERVESEKVGRKFRGRKFKDGVTSQGEIEEELDPETKEALKGISANDPRAKEFMNRMNNRTRSGIKSKIGKIADELKDATK